MAYKYAYQGTEENVAKAVITNAPISTKSSAMIAQFIKHKPVVRARAELESVLKQQAAIPFTRYSEGAGHKKKIGPGKFPKKATEMFIQLLDSAVANAKDKGFDEDLKVLASSAHQASKGYRYGRKRGQKRKSTHIEIVVGEDKQ